MPLNSPLSTYPLEQRQMHCSSEVAAASHSSPKLLGFCFRIGEMVEMTPRQIAVVAVL